MTLAFWLVFMGWTLFGAALFLEKREHARTRAQLEFWRESAQDEYRP
jgi:hypothetical protein